MSAFTELGKAIPSFVQQKIIESWLEWKGSSQIGREQTKPLPRLLISSFAEGISKTTNEELSLGQRVLNDLNNYMECCKTTNPSIYSSEIQNKLVENNIPVFAQKCPISCIDQPQHSSRSGWICWTLSLVGVVGGNYLYIGYNFQYKWLTLFHACVFLSLVSLCYLFVAI